MKRITPAILAGAMVAGHATAGFAQTSAPVKSSGGVNAGTAEGEGRLAGRTDLIVQGAGKDSTQRQAEPGKEDTRKEDARKRGITGSASGAVGAGASTATR